MSKKTYKPHLFVVRLTNRVHVPERQEYIEDVKEVSYNKEEFHMYFAKDAKGNPMRKQLKDGSFEELPAPIKSAIIFQKMEILQNPYELERLAAEEEAKKEAEKTVKKEVKK